MSSSAKVPVLAGDCRAGVPTRDWRLTPLKPVVRPQAMMSHVAWSHSGSSDRSSSTSQSWTIVADAGAKQIKTPTTLTGDETISSIGTALKSGVGVVKRRPFVVTSLNTKRYAPSKRPPLLTIPLRTSARERPLVARAVPTKQASRAGSLPTVVSKAEPRSPLPDTVAILALNTTAEEQKSLPLPLGASADQSTCENRAFVPRPLLLVQKLKEGKLMGSFPDPDPDLVVRCSTQGTKVKEPPLRPSCIPRTGIHQSGPSADQYSPKKTFVPNPIKLVQSLKEGRLICSFPTPQSVAQTPTQVTKEEKLSSWPTCIPCTRLHNTSGISDVPTAKEDTISKVATTPSPRILRMDCRELSNSLDVTRVAGHVKVPGTAVEGLVVDDHRTRTSARNRKVTTSKQNLYSQVVESGPRVDWSTTASPDLSSLPSQSWTIIVSADVKQIKTSATICGDQSLSSIDDDSKSGIAEVPTDSRGPCGTVSSSPSRPSSAITSETSTNPAKPIVGQNSMANINNPTEASSAKVSRTIFAATVLSLFRTAGTLMTTRMKVVDRAQVSSTIGVPESRTRIQTMPQRAIEVGRTFFLPPRHASQSSTETVSPKSLGTNVSWTRKLYPCARQGCEGVDESDRTNGDRDISSSKYSVWRGSRSPPGSPWFLRFRDNHREEARNVPFRQSRPSLKTQGERAVMRNRVPFFSYSLCFLPPPLSFVNFLSSMASVCCFNLPRLSDPERYRRSRGDCPVLSNLTRWSTTLSIQLRRSSSPGSTPFIALTHVLYGAPLATIRRHRQLSVFSSR